MGLEGHWAQLSVVKTAKVSISVAKQQTTPA